MNHKEKLLLSDPFLMTNPVDVVTGCLQKSSQCKKFAIGGAALYKKLFFCNRVIKFAISVCVCLRTASLFAPESYIAARHAKFFFVY